MRDQLARAGARRSEAEAVDNVVQPPLHDGQELLAGVFRGAGGQLEIAPELPLEDAVEAFQLLLLAEPDPILAGLTPAMTVHAGRNVPPLDGALGAIAARALQIQLHAFTPAQLANGIEMASHRSTSDFRLWISDFRYTRRFLGGRQPLWGN